MNSTTPAANPQADGANGRPPALTPAVAERIVRAVEQGVTRRDAARAAGIGRSTLQRWLAAGRRAESGPYRDFWDQVQAAEARAAQGYELVVHTAATGYDEVTTRQTVFPDGTTKTETTTRRVFDVAAAQWWLSRRRPENYGSGVELLRRLERELRDLEKKINARFPV